MRTRLFYMALSAMMLLTNGVCSAPARAQGDGDQILDGIGETSLIARYIFDGNTQDRSRDGHHASLHGSGGTFVDDKQFGRVLSLSGEDGVYLSLPAATLAEAETLSVVGWVLLAADSQSQRWFDFGKNADSSFYCDLAGIDAKEGYRGRITTSGAAGEQGPGATSIPTDRWVHVAVVLDPANKTLTIYADGVRAGQSKNISTGVDQVLD